MPTRRHRIARRILWAVVFVTAAALVVGLVLLGAWLADTTASIREQQKTNTSTNEAVLSCVDPEGECSKRNARSTSDALEVINKVTTLAAACADRPGRQTELQIESCILEGLRAAR